MPEGREQLGERCIGDLVVGGEELLEEDLVPLAAQMPGRLSVGGLRVGEEVEAGDAAVSPAAGIYLQTTS